MRYGLPLFIFFLACWAVMVLGAFFRPWLLLPDICMVATIYVFYFAPKAPIWRCLLPITLLMDIGANVCFGFHGLLYVLTAAAVFPLRPYWQITSVFEQLIGMILVASGFTVLQFLLLYVLEGIPAPVGWPWTIVILILLWPIMRGIAAWFVLKYLPRENS